MKQTSLILLFVSMLLTSCVTDAPYKLPIGSYNPDQLDDGWLVDTPESMGVSDGA